MPLYLLKRLGWMIVVLFAITVITFVLARVIPANPAASAAGLGATPEQIAAIAHRMGLDQPLVDQYVTYLTGLLHLDFGTSIQTGTSVRTDLGHYLPATLELVLVSFVVYVTLAIALGMWAAVTRSRAVDATIRILSIVSSAAPVFWVALMLQLVFFAGLDVLPGGGRLDIRETPPATITGFFTIDSLLEGNVPLFLSALAHLVLPVTAVVLSMLGVGVRLLRSSIGAELDEHYVRTAEAKGMRPSRILLRHVLKNALNPFVSMSGVQLGYLFAWIILVETIMQWPGIGLYAFTSFQSLDYSPIMGITLVVTVLFLMINLLVDLIYPLLAPRIRLAGR
jgi:ABC-type dipeptide/oligopeptide/nickel transport system permease component